MRWRYFVEWVTDSQTTTSTMLSLVRANWKRALAITLWTLLGLNVVFFVQRTIFSSCDVDALIEQYSAGRDAATSDGDGCTFARNDSTSRTRDPPETNWCMYDDEVDLRIIIMTFNRPVSLLRLLRFVTSTIHSSPIYFGEANVTADISLTILTVRY